MTAGVKLESYAPRRKNGSRIAERIWLIQTDLREPTSGLEPLTSSHYE
jgi:hypothetical protein